MKKYLDGRAFEEDIINTDINEHLTCRR